jgi:hypothetical protein
LSQLPTSITGPFVFSNAPFFYPPQIPGLGAWFDAGAPTTISTVIDSSVVNRWNNATNGNYFLTYTGGNNPTFTASNQYVNFNSGNPAYGLFFNNASGLVVGRTFTAFFVERRTDGFSNNPLVGSTTGFQTNQNLIIGYVGSATAMNSTISFDFDKENPNNQNINSGIHFI